MDKARKETIVSYFRGNDYLILNTKLAKIIGINEAIALCELMGKESYYAENNKLSNGYFYYTMKDFCAKFGLSRHSWSQVIHKLVCLKLIDCQRRGIPRKNFYKLNFIELDNLKRKLEMSGKHEVANGDASDVGVCSEVEEEDHSCGTNSGIKSGEIAQLNRSIENKEKESIDYNNSYHEFEKMVVENWNAFCDEHERMAKITEISNTRRLKLKKLYAKESFRDFKKILAGIAAQSFYLGSNDKGWVITFDWLISNDNNYLKLLEYRQQEPGFIHSTGKGWRE